MIQFTASMAVGDHCFTPRFTFAFPGVFCTAVGEPYALLSQRLELMMGLVKRYQCAFDFSCQLCVLHISSVLLSNYLPSGPLR